MSHVPVIAIDGPSGSGKGTLTQTVAREMGFHILDSGALYRLIGLAGRRAGLDLTDEAAVTGIAERLDVRFEPSDGGEYPLDVYLEGDPVTQAIRTDAAGRDASTVAALAAVRLAIVDLQLAFRHAPGLVADGRDMGTVVFPDADLKIFLTASAQARAERRYKQLKTKDSGVSLHDLFLSIQARDKQDTERSVSPLKPADDAFVIDSTAMTIDEVVVEALRLVRERLG